MEINILKCLEGASQAEGLTVVIDVFRAFTVECFMYEKSVGKIYAVGSVEDCLSLKKEHPEFILVGERNGVRIDGFDEGNSPYAISLRNDLQGKAVVHTTSAGVQGIVNATKAEEIITGSLVNASAVAQYILSKKPSKVSLVCMGLNAKEDTEEDILCAEYIKALVEGKNLNIHAEISNLKRTSGKKFFDMSNYKIFPEPDFFMCLVPNVFDFVIKAERHGSYVEMKRVGISTEKENVS